MKTKTMNSAKNLTINYAYTVQQAILHMPLHLLSTPGNRQEFCGEMYFNHLSKVREAN